MTVVGFVHQLRAEYTLATLSTSSFASSLRLRAYGKPTLQHGFRHIYYAKYVPLSQEWTIFLRASLPLWQKGDSGGFSFPIFCGCAKITIGDDGDGFQPSRK